jgi:hypothetical protein
MINFNKAEDLEALLKFCVEWIFRIRGLVSQTFTFFAIANFLFFLDKPFGYAQGETKKIIAVNKKAEIFNIDLKIKELARIVKYFVAYAGSIRRGG